MSRQDAVVHIDADCFYASAERLRDEHLVGVPIGVLGNQGACVIAKSYEMKACGVKTGEPIWEAIPKCPEGVFVKRDFRWMEELSRAMLAIIRESCSPRVEWYSVDEVFGEMFNMPGKGPEETAIAIRDRIMDDLGIPVTVGVARSRTLAKLISDSAKPFGAKAVLDRESEENLLADRPVTEITGIADRRAERLATWGIRTCLDLARADRRLVRELLTASGEALWWELNGDPVTAMRLVRPRHKALSRGGSFGEDIISPNRLYAWLVRNVERLIEELHYHELLAGRLVVWVGYKDGRAGLGKAKFAVPTDRFDQLLDVGRPCLRSAWIPKVRAERMQVIAEGLTSRRERPLGLFDDPGAAARMEIVSRVKREINERHGRFALRSALTLPLAEVYDDYETGYDICDIRGKMCF